MDVEALLAPVSDQSPVGPDLSYDGARQEIEAFFEQSAEDADGIDWRDVIRKIVAQSAETKDVWLAIYLARAGARKGDLGTVVAGVQMLAGLFDRYWDTVHPSLEEYGFAGRKGPCESLARIGEFLGPLRRTVIFEHPRLGRYTGEDLERFAAEGDAADGFGQFRAAIADVPNEDLQQQVDRLDQLREAVRQVDTILMANAEGDSGTNFQLTYEAIEAIRRALAPFAGIVEEAKLDVGDQPVVETSTQRTVGKVESREDVVRALDAVAEYYSRREPGSPIPVALRRIRNWVDMDFMAILADIAPNSVSEAGQVLLTRPNEDSSNY